MVLNNYTVPESVGWTEHDRLEILQHGHIKIWDLQKDYPYTRGDGDKKYKLIKYNYDANGIFTIV